MNHKLNSNKSKIKLKRVIKQSAVGNAKTCLLLRSVRTLQETLTLTTSFSGHPSFSSLLRNTTIFHHLSVPSLSSFQHGHFCFIFSGQQSNPDLTNTFANMKLQLLALIIFVTTGTALPALKTTHMPEKRQSDECLNKSQGQICTLAIIRAVTKKTFQWP